MPHVVNLCAVVRSLAAPARKVRRGLGSIGSVGFKVEGLGSIGLRVYV